MAMSTAAVGQRLAAWTGRLDARWLMAYAAAVEQYGPIYMDTTRAGGLLAHPVFPIAPEWALLTDPATDLGLGLDDDEVRRGVHAGHDLVLHRPIAEGVDVVLQAVVAGVEATSVGARLTIRFDAADASGAALWSTWMRSIYPGVGVEGPPCPDRGAPTQQTSVDPGGFPGGVEHRVELDPGAAHVYSECARIWNPIHTDRAEALKAGLSDIVLHGSATLAHGVSAAMLELGIGPDAVARLGGTFRAMVRLPSTITVAIDTTTATRDGTARFEVRNDANELAVKDGFVVMRTAIA